MVTRSPRLKRYAANDGRSIATVCAYALCLISIVVASSACAKDGEPTYSGFVLDVSGRCVLDTGRQIQDGQRLPAGATLHFQPPQSRSDFVDIALADGTRSEE